MKFWLLPIGAFFINGNQYDESTPKKAQFDKPVKHFTQNKLMMWAGLTAWA